MSGTYSLRSVFETEFDRLCQLRASNPKLDEMCRDYDLLTRDLTKRLGATDNETLALIADIKESLRELVEEIRNAMDSSASEHMVTSTSQIEER